MSEHDAWKKTRERFEDEDFESTPIYDELTKEKNDEQNFFDNA